MRAVWTMWARLGEMALGLWMIAAAWVLPGPRGAGDDAVAIAGGALVAATAAFAIVRRSEWPRLGVAGVATGVLVYSWLCRSREALLLENLVIACLSVLVFVLVPNRASEPPAGWGVADVGRRAPDRSEGRAQNG